jgi:hypothetical protein
MPKSDSGRIAEYGISMWCRGDIRDVMNDYPVGSEEDIFIWKHRDQITHISECCVDLLTKLIQEDRDNG